MKSYLVQCKSAQLPHSVAIFAKYVNIIVVVGMRTSLPVRILEKATE